MASASEVGTTTPVAPVFGATAISAPVALRRISRLGARLVLAGALLIVLGYAFDLATTVYFLFTGSYLGYTSILNWQILALVSIGAGIVCVGVGWVVDRRGAAAMFGPDFSARLQARQWLGLGLMLGGALLVSGFFFLAAFIAYATTYLPSAPSLPTTVAQGIWIGVFVAAVAGSVGWYIERSATLTAMEQSIRT